MRPPLPSNTDWTTYGPLTARSVIGKHYGVKCTEVEARAEVLSLARKAENGTQDDSDEALTARLCQAYGVFDLSRVASAAYGHWKCSQ